MQNQPENLTNLSFENYSTHFGFAKNLSSLSERRSIFPFVADELKFVVRFVHLCSTLLDTIATTKRTTSQGNHNF